MANIDHDFSYTKHSHVSKINITVALAALVASQNSTNRINKNMTLEKKMKLID